MMTVSIILWWIFFLYITQSLHAEWNEIMAKSGPGGTN